MDARPAPSPAVTDHPRHRDVLLGAALAVAAELLFASMGAAIKVVSETLPNESVVFFRNAFGLLVLLPLLVRGGLPGLRTSVLPLHLLRAGAGLGAMYCFFYAIANIPLAEAVLLKMTAPLFLPLIAFLWLRERMPAGVGIAVAIGFAGVALILQPGFSEVSTVAWVALLGGALAALAKATVRRLGATEPGPRIVFYFAVIATAASAVPAAAIWVTPAPEAWAWLLAIGMLATGGQLLMTRAYALAPASRVGPYTYASVLFATAYGWLFWGEILDILTAAGAALVIAAGVLAGRRVRRPASRVPVTETVAPADETGAVGR
jgi:drug/metabolite transporter (DMT)-like permease